MAFVRTALAGGSLAIHRLSSSAKVQTANRFKEMPSRYSIRWGGAYAQGRRPSMEDEHAAVVDAQLAYFGVFDGHAGPRCSEYLGDNLHTEFFKFLTKGEVPSFRTIATALRASFDAVEAAWFAKAGAAKRGPMEDGSCAVSVVVDLHGGTVTAANTGDSRAVITRRVGKDENIDSGSNDGDEVLPLSFDHKPDRASELERIRQMGGNVVYMHGVPRVVSPRRSGLAISRAFGDYSFKVPRPVVTHSPEIYAERLGGEGRTDIVIACDGIWDVMSNEDVSKLARAESDPQKASVAIVKAAYDLGSTDNLSVIVVYLDPKSNGANAEVIKAKM